MAETTTRLTPGVSADDMVGHLRGGWLLAARLLWLGLAGGALVLFSLAVPVGYRLLSTPCAAAECFADQLTPEGVAALAAAGLTPTHYALYNVALAIALVVVTTGAAALIFLRRSDEPVALYVSLTLVLLGVFVNSYSDAISLLGDLPLLAADLYHALMWVSGGSIG